MIYKMDVIYFIILFILTVIFVYFTPQIIAGIYLFTLLLFFYNSKKDYFWVAFTIVIQSSIGSLLYNNLYIINTSNYGVSYLDLFSILALLKTFNIKLKRIHKILFIKAINIWIIYLLFLVLLGLAEGMKLTNTTGEGYSSYYYVIKTLVLLPLFYSIPKLIKNQFDIIKIANILFFALFINIAGQISEIIMYKSFHVMLGGFFPVDIENFDLVRPMWGIYLNFISLFVALYFYYSKNKIFNNYYLICIILICLCSIFITATRGYIIASFFMFFSSMIYFGYHKSYIKFFRIIATFTIVFLVFFFSNSILKEQVYRAWERLETVELIFEGDMTAGGTNRRLNDRDIPVMEKFYEKPILGWGFSATGIQTHDIHVGNQSTLMSGGIIGFTIILNVWFSIYNSVRKLKKKYNFNSRQKRILRLIIIFLLSLIIIHSTSSELFGYLTYTRSGQHLKKILFLSVIFTLMNRIMVIMLKEKYIGFENRGRS